MVNMATMNYCFCWSKWRPLSIVKPFIQQFNKNCQFSKQDYKKFCKNIIFFGGEGGYLLFVLFSIKFTIKIKNNLKLISNTEYWITSCKSIQNSLIKNMMCILSWRFTRRHYKHGVTPFYCINSYKMTCC